MPAYSLWVEIPGAPPCSLRLNTTSDQLKRKSKRDRIVDQWFLKIHRETAKDKPHQPLEFARVQVARCSSAKPSTSTLRASADVLLEALERAGIIAGTTPRHIGRPLVTWETARPCKTLTRIRVTECAPHELDMRGGR